MARVPVSEEYRTGEGGEQFPRLSKLETGEVARLCLPDNDAWAEWVHTMRAPKIEHGVAIIINKSRKDGSTYPDYSYAFVGQRICLGDPAVLEDKGIDPARCPACESAQRGIKDMKPVRRFALPVIRYATKNPRTADLRPTPGAEVLVWGLTSKMYDQLLDCAKQMREMLRLPPEAPMNLRDMDVVVECESGDFQRLVFKPPRYPAYQDPTIGTQVAALIGALWSDVENRPTDEQLKGACGRDGDKGYMLVDVRKMEDAWRVADGGQAPSADPLNGAAPGQAQQGSVTTGLNVLLEGGRPAAAQDQPAADPGVVPPAAAGDPFAGATQAAAPATTTSTPAPAAASPSPTESPAAAPAPVSDPFVGAPQSASGAAPVSTTATSPETTSAAQSSADPFAGGSQAAAVTPTAPAASSPPAVSPEAPAAAPPSEPRKSLSFDQILGMSGKPA